MASPRTLDRELREFEERFEESRSARLERERQWYINLAYFLGDQWVEWDPVTRRLRRPEVPPWRVLSVTNMIQSSVRTEFAKLTRQRPVAAVQPLGSDPDRQAQARTADKIREFLWDRTETFEHLKNTLMWTLVTGTGFLKVYWDPAAGEMITDESGSPIPLGEIAVCAVSPFEIYPDPLAESLDDAAWVFHAKIRSVEWVLRTYGVEVEPEPVAETKLLGGRLFASSRVVQAYEPKRAVLLKEYWERPTPQSPEGRYVVYVGSKRIVDGPNPYPTVPIPFIRIRHIITPGAFWGESTVTHLIDPQTQYNKTRSQAIEIKNLMVKPKWTVPKGSIERPITTEPGETIQYIPVGGHKPEPVRPPEVPASLYRELEQLRSEIYELSGQHEVSRAQNPQGVRSGIAIAYLQEQDDTRLHPTVQEYERAVERLETYKLRLARQFYQEPRVARIVGQDGAVEVFTFTAQDIPEDVDVRVQSGSSLPPSRVARQEFVLQLWQQRIIQDPRVVLKLLEFGNVEGLYDDANLDTAQAQRENQDMAQGILHEAEDFENHDIHIYEHNKFRKTPEYDQLPDEIKEIFRQHVAQHEAFRMQQGGGIMGLLAGQGGESPPVPEGEATPQGAEPILAQAQEGGPTWQG